MRPVLRSAPPDGWLTGDPMPFALGGGIPMAELSAAELSLRDRLAGDEQVLAIAPLDIAASDHEMRMVITTHAFHRLATPNSGGTTSVLTVAYDERVAAVGSVPFTVDLDVDQGALERVVFGSFRSQDDLDLVMAAVASMRLQLG